MVRLVLASPIAAATRGDREIEVDFEGTLKELFEVVANEYGRQFEQRILEGNGALRRFVNVYVNGEDARFLDGLDTRIPRDATVDLLPAISGGCGGP
jgi:sulfur-carrier protein